MNGTVSVSTQDLTYGYLFNTLTVIDVNDSNLVTKISQITDFLDEDSFHFSLFSFRQTREL